MIKRINKTLEILFFLILIVFQFSFGELTTNWIILFIIIALSSIPLYILKKIKQVHIKNLSTAFSIVLLLIFDFSEKVNFLHQFNIPNDIGTRIPLSTIILVTATIIYIVKVLIEGKIRFTVHPLVSYFFYSCVFLLVLMILFFPFLSYHYQMTLNSNAQLLNKILKYLLIILITTNYVQNEKKLFQLSFGLTMSLILVIILNIIF